MIFYAWKNSDFYRQFWQTHNFNPEKDFHDISDLKKIPVLTKTDLLAATMSERSILNSNDGYYFTDISSGTGGKPLVILKQYHSMPLYFDYILDLVKISRISFLALRPTSSATAFLGAGIAGQFLPRGSIISLGDVNDFIYSATIALNIEANFLVLRPATAISFAASLEKQGYSPSKIKFLYLSGEPITLAAISFLRKVYSNATIIYTYAMTEGPASMGIRSSLCTTLEDLSPNAYHLNIRDFFFETSDKALLVTSLHELPTPLIRFKNGDQTIIKDNFQCSCGFPAGKIAIIGPRSGEDSYKIGNFFFQASEIHKALAKLNEFFTENFELQVEQIAEKDQLVLTLDFTLQTINNPTPFLTDAIREVLEREVRISRSQTLGDAIGKGYVMPINIRFSSSLSTSRILPPQEFMKHFL
ncbi:MAG: hypothetical protein A3H69_05340 [Candidatus Sungbacteria bacterium RIFCSPLOWO2_02_FULL_47_9]|uniref:AMP-dependent synthetase/ligase domain-containing protein n=1 Tax=Candidatus Sungbacteria bacterium RIFCSPHIGHO2_01_FULL_47_32 TaxID=1802264 RepID=A0A1G2K713_9BACT|nr:MAG: hypothetical protein UX72_C0002G0010 [Parcubacteria group bacterium GW2011_GWA2_47_10]OGZ94993.1 MAG: hypothetical protein A2633_06025 [Candidatus Sungbacteria bacterium RIFCSPHIGHO2_01_FULL_47_32]OGZ99392.1 MAG: hypothetical protein A3D57_00855 [Candidatus Sungbacteria bacterium RIFCSPHIGHO2_02_FULL_46_12]OHA05657.1 MAG: hypothetical protein A3A28_04405 [Candidatus Sungbacteria bacterium RIFCSPLOWO2_01_FULL_47_32]OHA10220.1 MAG: hypothetical protein A3H69_05340 [Candidatus Sungbacteria